MLERLRLINHPVVAVGYSERELLPEYDSPQHQERAEAILAYLATIPEVRKEVKPDNSAIDIKTLFKKARVVEVVGGGPYICVRDAIRQITHQGYYAYVNFERILKPGDHMSNADVMRIVAVEGKRLYGQYRTIQLGRSRCLYKAR